MEYVTESRDLNPGPIVRVSTEGTILDANDAARELFGGKELRGRQWLDVCPGVERPFWDRMLAGPEHLLHESEIGGRLFSFLYRRASSGDGVLVYGADVTRLRRAEDALRQTEKMATLGTLAAGIAHELNNPAAAATRGAQQLREAFAHLQDAMVPLTRVRLTAERAAALAALVRQDRESSAKASHVDPLTRSDMEAEVEDWLERLGVPAAWELAPALVGLGYDAEELTAIAEEWGEAAPAVIGWIARAQPVLALAREIGEAAARISEIVGALKTYSHTGTQSTVRRVRVTDGIESTLVMLRGKLKRGARVVREYEPDLPEIEAYGSELNQVWTNLIDNAADAAGERGQITLRARRDDNQVLVEVEDDGPGMPEHILACIFDPFFTTKEPGVGTGLGLSTSRNIVLRHGGTIDVASRPGRTTFTVRLPLHLPLDRGDGAPAGAPTA